MSSQRAAREAIRTGIGARLLELGYVRQSERRYVKEDETYRRVVRFRLLADGRFSDVALMSAKAVEETVAACGIPLFQYNYFEPEHAHIYIDPLRYRWLHQRYAESQLSIGRKLLNAVGKHAPWRRPPDQGASFADDGVWQPASDPAGCAGESLAVWRDVSERWLEKMEEPLHFARWYDTRDWSIVHRLERAIVWAWAGDMDRAIRYLAAEYSKRDWTRELALERLRNTPHIEQRYRTEEDFLNAAIRSENSGDLAAERAMALASFLRIDPQLLDQ